MINEDLKIPTLLEGDLWICRSHPHGHPQHRHIELEMNLVTHGYANYLLGHQTCPLRPGTILWLFPEQDHVLLEQSSDFAMWVMYMKPELIHRVCTQETTQILHASDPPGEFRRQVAPVQFSHLNSLFEDVSAKRADPILFNAGLAYAFLLSWSAYLESDILNLSRSVHPAVQKTVTLLREDCDSTSLKQLGRKFGLSASRLSGLFKEQTGISFAEFRNKQRLERFLRTYDKHETTMSAAALEAGFGSYPQFYRVFTEIVGVNPAEYYRKTD